MNVRKDHETKTNDLISEGWNSNKREYRSSKHTHYRMVSVEVGCPLQELFGAYELLEATRMAFLGWFFFQRRNSVLTISNSNTASPGKAQEATLRYKCQQYSDSQEGRRIQDRDSH